MVKWMMVAYMVRRFDGLCKLQEWRRCRLLAQYLAQLCWEAEPVCEASLRAPGQVGAEMTVFFFPIKSGKHK